MGKSICNILGRFTDDKLGEKGISLLIAEYFKREALQGVNCG